MAKNSHRPAWGRLVLGLWLWLLCAADAQADAEIVFVPTDPPDTGFFDPTAVAPVGGNDGATLGEQRLLALEYAASIWGRLLDSEVQIRVDVHFEALGCNDGGYTLAQARTFDWYSNYASMPPNIWYHAALADRLERVDIEPGEVDIVITINSEVDDPSCTASNGFYLGFDHDEGGGTDLVAVMLHELAHGLGSYGITNLVTGNMLRGWPSIYETMVYDLEAGQYWAEMNPVERLASATNVRQVVWDGAGVTAAAPGVLAGTPQVTTEPVIAGFDGAVGTADFGPALTATAVVGVIKLADDGVDPDPADTCEDLAADSMTGNIALINRGTCFFVDKVNRAQLAGAVGVIIAENLPNQLPGGMTGAGDTSFIQIPSVRITLEDADILKAAMASGEVTGSLDVDPNRMAGAAPSGEVYLYASDPISVGSSISHWDPIASPNLLMEPNISSTLSDDVDLTLPLLRDIGWRPFKCGNGDLEPGESCDDGDDNSDATPNACRSSCLPAYCGDGVTDDADECDDGNNTSGDGCTDACVAEVCGDGVINDAPNETCDDGDDNSDATPNACRSSCQPAGCGDGVIDDGESCDDPAGNSDSLANACRTTCLPATCGDGVLDDGESCDDPAGNSDSLADACRTTCLPAACGDGVLDMGEACDAPGGNSDSIPNSCRPGCVLPGCGDGVIDDGESCDDAGDNDDSSANACRTNCLAAGCGDGVIDDGETCDDGDGNSDVTPDACRSSCLPAICGDGVIDEGETCDDAVGNSDLDPDACRNDCTSAGCGDGVVDDGEACDDGDDNSDNTPDACRNSCRVADCGDAVIDSGETCDDGNATAGDGCDDACQIEAMPGDGDGDGDADGGPAAEDGSVGGDGDGDGSSPGDGDGDGVGVGATGDGDTGGSGDEPADLMGDDAGSSSASGCGCSVPGAPARRWPPEIWLLALGLAGVRASRRCGS